MSNRFNHMEIIGEGADNLFNVKHNIGYVRCETDLAHVRTAAKVDKFTGRVKCYGDEKHTLIFREGEEAYVEERDTDWHVPKDKNNGRDVCHICGTDNGERDPQTGLGEGRSGWYCSSCGGN